MRRFRKIAWQRLAVGREPELGSCDENSCDEEGAYRRGKASKKRQKPRRSQQVLVGCGIAFGKVDDQEDGEDAVYLSLAPLPPPWPWEEPTTLCCTSTACPDKDPCKRLNEARADWAVAPAHLVARVVGFLGLPSSVPAWRTGYIYLQVSFLANLSRLLRVVCAEWPL